MVKKAMVICVALAALMVLAGGAAHAAKVKAKLTRLKGDVQVKASAAAGWKAARDGDVVDQGAQIKCSAGAEVYVAWGSGHVLKVSPQSTVTLSQLEKSAAGETSKISLEKGKVFANAKKLQTGSTFEIKTPTAVAGVRGTGFECSDTSVAVLEGTVEVSSDGQSVEVDAGLFVEIPEIGEAFSEPVAIPDDMLSTLQEDFTQTDAVSIEVSAELETLSSEEGESTEETAEDTGEDTEETAEEQGEVSEELDSAVDQADTALDLNTESNIVETSELGNFEPGTGGIEIEIVY